MHPSIEVSRLANRLSTLHWRSLCCSSCCPERTEVEDDRATVEPHQQATAWEENDRTLDRVHHRPQPDEKVIAGFREGLAQRGRLVCEERRGPEALCDGTTPNGFLRITARMQATGQPQNGNGAATLLLLQLLNRHREETDRSKKGRPRNCMTLVIDSITVKQYS